MSRSSVYRNGATSDYHQGKKGQICRITYKETDLEERVYCLVCRRLFPTEKYFQGGCNLALTTSWRKKKMLLPANGSEKCMTDYCNHNNVFRSSEIENEMPDKHMLFLIKNDLVLSGPHRFQGCSVKAEHGGDLAPSGCLTVSHPSPTQHHLGLLLPVHLIACCKTGLVSSFLCLAYVNRSALPGPAQCCTKFNA